MRRLLIFTSALLLVPCQASAEPQTVIRDAGGRTIGTATTDSQGTTVFRDSSGRTTSSATPSNQGTTTFRDSSGRTTGTTSTPWRLR